MVKNRSPESASTPEKPEARFIRLIDFLVGDSGEVLLDASGTTVVGSKRVLMASGDRRYSVGRYDSEHRAPLTEQVLADPGVSVGLLYGVVEVYVGKSEESAFRSTYYVGNDGVEAELDMRHNPENPQSGMAVECLKVAQDLGFAKHWVDSAKQAEENLLAPNNLTVEAVDDRLTGYMERFLKPYMEQ
jgi:hypothetical protein